MAKNKGISRKIFSSSGGFFSEKQLKDEEKFYIMIWYISFFSDGKEICPERYGLK